MSPQKLPLEAIQKVKQYINSVLVLPDSENHPRSPASFNTVDELPEPDSLDALGDLFKMSGLAEEETYTPNTEGRWFISAVNPGAALIKLPGLQLKPGFRFVTYLNRTTDSGIGVTWAVPEDLGTTVQLEKALAKSGSIDLPPHPQGAFADFMEIVVGDRSFPSYAVASILRRELKEFGALGKYCNWSHHRLINAIPPQANWQWQGEAPKDLSPKVLTFADGRTAVEFFTCRVVAPIGIFRHLDQYPADSYIAQCQDQILATAQRPQK